MYYGAKGLEYKYKLIPNNATKQTTLTELKKFTKYAIQVSASSNSNTPFALNF